MSDFEVSEQLKGEAIGLGLCSQWTNEWKSESSKQELIDKYKKGLDFSIKNDWPSSEFIDANFDKTLLKMNLIWNNDNINVSEGINGVYVLNGNSKGAMHFGWYSAATIFVRHDCNVDIVCDGSAIVQIRVSGKARASVRCDDMAKCSVIVYGEDAIVDTKGNVRVRRK